MPRVILTERALQGLERCRDFLALRNPRADVRAGQAISRALELLEFKSGMGRQFDDTSDLRELIIGFGATGYVAL